MTLDTDLFFSGKPQERALYDQLDALLRKGRPCVSEVKKTSISYAARPSEKTLLRFAWVSFPPQAALKRQHALLLTLGLPHVEQHPLLQMYVEAYPGRLTHHLAISSPAELDDSLDEIIQLSYDFALLRTRG